MKNLILLLALCYSHFAFSTCDKPPIFEKMSTLETVADFSKYLIRRYFSEEEEVCPEKGGRLQDGTELEVYATIEDVVDDPDIPTGAVDEVQVLSPDELKAVFEKVSQDCRIPYGFNLDGCFSRAHAMAKVLEQEGIRDKEGKQKKIYVGKAFFADYLAMEARPKINGKIYPMSHAAIFVLVKEKDKIVPYIIDPSVASEPLSIYSFVSKISESPLKTKVQLTNRYQFTFSKPYQDTGVHPNVLKEWGRVREDRAQSEIEMYSEAITPFTQKKCADFMNVVGTKVPYQIEQSMKWMCERREFNPSYIPYPVFD